MKSDTLGKKVKTLLQTVYTSAFGTALFAIAHRMMLESEYYTNSILINIEFAFLISAVFLSPLSIIFCVVRMIQKRFRESAHLILASFIAILAVFVAIVVDAPTIVHMT